MIYLDLNNLIIYQYQFVEHYYQSNLVLIVFISFSILFLFLDRLSSVRICEICFPVNTYFGIIGIVIYYRYQLYNSQYNCKLLYINKLYCNDIYI